LKGTERKSFMKSCLSEKSTAATTGATAAASGAAGSAAAKGSTQQEKMKTCSADARSKGLKGADRRHSEGLPERQRCSLARAAPRPR